MSVERDRVRTGRRAFAPAAAALLVGLLALGVYVLTLARSIFWGDSPELTTAAYLAGVPHPTGYPLYMLLGYGFTHLLPVGSVAFRMNLLSALAAAAAVGLAYLLILRLTRSRLAAGIAALLFAFSRSFWSQAIIAEVYALHVLFMAAVLLAVAEWDRHGDRRWLRAAALLYGLSFTHHLTSVLIAPALLLLVVTSRHRGQFLKELRWTLPLCVAPLALYAYIPLAALRDPPANWGDPRTWPNFLAHVTGDQYQSQMFKSSAAQLWERFLKYAGTIEENRGFLLQQFSPVFLWLAPVGMWSLFRRSRRWLAVTLAALLGVVGYSINYDIADIEVYYLPAHLMVAIWLGCGLRQAGAWVGLLWRRLSVQPVKRRALNRLLGASLAILPLSLLSRNWVFNDLSQEWGPITYARAALEALKPNAVVFAGGDEPYFPLLYTRWVERRRPDVMIVSYNGLLLPERLRLTTRLTGDGLKVRAPECYLTSARGDATHAACLLKQLIVDNIANRPLYVLGEPLEVMEKSWISETIRPFYPATTTNMPLIELSRRSAPLERAATPTAARTRVVFGKRRADGGVTPALELRGFDAQVVKTGETPWLRLRYDWRVQDPALAAKAHVRAVFGDADGNYETNTRGPLQFHDYHRLGYGAGARKEALPPEFRETIDVFVPPAGWDKQRSLWLALVVDDEFLDVEGDPSHYVRVGDLPVTPAPNHQSRLAGMRMSGSGSGAVRPEAPK